MEYRIKKAIPVLTTALILWAFLIFTQKAFLYKNADLSLFIFDWAFLKEFLMTPGGFLGWAGAFFTQFLFIPWLGALLWVAMLVLAGILTVKVFRISSSLAALATLPAALLTIANMSLGYGIFIMRPQDYFFAPTLGYLLMPAIMAAVWSTPKTWQKIALLIIFAFAGYYLAGIFALAGVLCAGLGVAVQSDADTAKRISVSAASVILFFCVPLLMYGLFTRYRLNSSWTIGLPSLSEDLWTVPVRLPYYILMGLSVVFSLCRNLLSSKKGSKALSLGITAAAILSVIIFWYRDENFKSELEMSIATDNCDWKKVTAIFQKASDKHLGREKKALVKRQEKIGTEKKGATYESILDSYEDNFFQPTRVMVILRDLALFKQGKALDSAFSMRDGGRQQKSRTQIPMVFQIGRPVYFHYGLVNMEYRWSLEDQVEHGWSFSTLKYMAMHATLQNETVFAAKYLDKLDKTIFYRNWSRSQRPLSANAAAMSATSPYKEVIPLMCFDDRMSNDRVKMETYIMNHFSQDRAPQSTSQFDQAALLWAMRSQNIPLFWKALAQYLETMTDSRLPRHVQEAILLYSDLEKEDMGIQVDKAVSNSYTSFRNYIKNTHFGSNREASYPIRQKFGNTFYYYYFFVRDLQTY